MRAIPLISVGTVVPMLAGKNFRTAMLAVEAQDRLTRLRSYVQRKWPAETTVIEQP